VPTTTPWRLPSGSCAGSIQHQHPLLAGSVGDEGLAKQAAAAGAKTYGLSQFVVDVLGTDDVSAYFPRRVTSHPTFQSARMVGVGDRAVRLRNVRGIDLVELTRWDACCGCSGTFAVNNPDVSRAMLGDTMGAVIETGAEVLCAGDRSCLVHIGGGLDRIRAGVRALHLVQILASIDSDHSSGHATERTKEAAA
jgi:L-lactate dehydrogenase complex protein LldE